jgi:hypothetical protein
MATTKGSNYTDATYKGKKKSTTGHASMTTLLTTCSGKVFSVTPLPN